MRAVQVLQLGQPGKMEGSRHGVDVGRTDLQLTREQVAHLGRHPLLQLEPNGRAGAAATDLFLQRLQQVLRPVVVHFQVGVARHAEDMTLQHPHAREEPVEIGGDDILERHEDARLRRHEPAEQRRDLDPREVDQVRIGVSTRIARFSDRFEMYGNGWPGSTASGVSTGKIRVLNIACSTRAWLASSSVQRRMRIPSAASGVPAPVEPRQPVGNDLGTLADPGQLLGRRQPIPERGPAEPGHFLPLQTRDADLEELVQVAGGDGEELDSFEQREVGVFADGEDALVEGEPAQLAVQVALVRWQECAIGTAGRPTGIACRAADETIDPQR